MALGCVAKTSVRNASEVRRVGHIDIKETIGVADVASLREIPNEIQVFDGGVVWMDDANVNVQRIGVDANARVFGPYVDPHHLTVGPDFDRKRRKLGGDGKVVYWVTSDQISFYRIGNEQPKKILGFGPYKQALGTRGQYLYLGVASETYSILQRHDIFNTFHADILVEQRFAKSVDRIEGIDGGVLYGDAIQIRHVEDNNPLVERHVRYIGMHEKQWGWLDIGKLALANTQEQTIQIFDLQPDSGAVARLSAPGISEFCVCENTAYWLRPATGEILSADFSDVSHPKTKVVATGQRGSRRISCFKGNVAWVAQTRAPGWFEIRMNQ